MSIQAGVWLGACTGQFGPVFSRLFPENWGAYVSWAGVLPISRSEDCTHLSMRRQKLWTGKRVLNVKLSKAYLRFHRVEKGGSWGDWWAWLQDWIWLQTGELGTRGEGQWRKPSPLLRAQQGATEAGMSEGTSETVSDAFFIIITEGQRVSQGQKHWYCDS